MNIINLEKYIREKYGLISVLEEKKKDLCSLISDKLNWKEIIDEFILNVDIREYFLGEQIKLSDKSELVCRNLLVMIVKLYDCSKSKKYSSNKFENDLDDDDDAFDQEYGKDLENKNQGTKNRIYYFTFTTGRSNSLDKKNDVLINALEYERINFFENQLLPGTKLILNPNNKNDSIQVQNSILLLRNNNIKLIGGSVTSMIESWKLNNILNEYRSKNFAVSKNLSKKPPKFIPFLDKETEKKELDERVQDAQNNYKLSKEKDLNENFKESKEYDNQLLINNQAYNELISSIKQYKKKNLKDQSISLEKFNSNQVNNEKIINKKDKKSSLDYNSDPGAPLKKYGRSKHEKIDSDAQKFIKTNKTDILLFDHLFSKLGISNEIPQENTSNHSETKKISIESRKSKCAKMKRSTELITKKTGNSRDSDVNVKNNRSRRPQGRVEIKDKKENLRHKFKNRDS